MAVCNIHLHTERDPAIEIVPLGNYVVQIDLGRHTSLFVSDHQAYELEAALARHRGRHAAGRRPVPAEAATGCEVDADDLLESMALSYDVRRDQAEYDARTAAEMAESGATNCPTEVP